MSCAKQPPRTRSFYIVESDAQLSMRPHNDQIQQPAKIIPAVVLWFTLATLAQFISDVRGAIAELVIDGLCWLFSEFVAGCAAYAEAMYPMQIAAARPENPADQAVVAPSKPAIRPRLIVVSDSTRQVPGDDLPKQVATPCSIAVRDRASREMISSARAPAARRKNRPR